MRDLKITFLVLVGFIMKYLSRNLFLYLCLGAFSISFYCQAIQAGTIVRMELQQGSSKKNIDIHLSDSLTPLTVASFLKYVDATPVVATPPVPSQSYDGTFIHSVSQGFLVEGGKFHYTDTSAVNDFVCTDCVNPLVEPDFIFPAGLQLVTTDAPIPSEFLRSNVRGTIAMKKVNNIISNVQSTPSHWFINLADNSAALDVFTGQNLERSPFTVFGEVINNTLANVDAISTKNNTSFPVLNDIHFDFTGMPVVDFDTKETINTTNLVRINQARKLLSIRSDLNEGIDSDVDFGINLLNTSKTATVTVSNASAFTLKVQGVNTAAVNSPYFISAADNNCDGITLSVGGSCNFKVEFSASQEDAFEDNIVFDFEFGDGVGNAKKPLQYAYKLKARAVLSLVQAISVTPEAVDFRAVKSDSSKTLSLNITNSGTADLTLFAINITGQNANEFSLLHNCNDVNPLAPGVSCLVNLTFSPISVASKETAVVITSDDPDSPSVSIPVAGFGDTDTDGVSALIEDAAPNGGDNNTDDVLDSVQNNLASLPGKNNAYYSIKVDDAFVLNDVAAVSDDALIDPPTDVQFTLGASGYVVVLNNPGEQATVGIILPSGVLPTAYYMYGVDIEDSKDSSKHWFKYTRTTILDNFSFTSPSGAVSRHNLIQITVQDGGPGDFDGAQDGRVTIGPAAVGYPITSAATDSGSGGSFNIILCILFSSLLILLRSYP